MARTRWKLGRPREITARVVKRVRNLVADPWPRTAELLYLGYDLAPPDIAFRFRLGRHTYTHHVTLHDLPEDTFAGLRGAEWEPLLHHIGLMFAVYHWRVTDVAVVRSTCSPLPDDLREFHEALALGSLAEFRYRWGLDPRRPVLFRSDVSGDLPPPRRVDADEKDEKVLVLNGGGKDSIVAAELLRAMDVPFAWFTARPTAVRQQVAEISGATQYRAGYRTDRALDEHARYPWGTAAPTIPMVSSLALIPAILHGFRFVAIGNEYSANFPMRVFRGMDINHQYAKAYPLEVALAEVIGRRLVDGVAYFSLLRPFYELRLAALFSRFDKYVGTFLSCNNPPSPGVWCKACPKCAFVFLILYPFLDASQRDRVFTENLLYRPQIRSLMLDLTGRWKPWECVGTSEESQLALYLSLQKSPEMHFGEWPFRQDLERACAELDVPAATERCLHGFHGPHRVPSHLEARLREAVRQLGPASQR